jgi:RNA 2',3'-cyclic 3'-phosphodiesterase
MADGRYFFALWPEESVREGLMALARRTARRGSVHHPADLHMTLVFLGQISDDQLPGIEAVADAIRGKAFTLQIDGLGYWSRPRILWAAPRQTPEPLSQLVFDLQNGLKACGFEPEKRRYQPHVTLYRKAPPAEAKAIEPAIEWPVTSFVLAVSGGSEPGEPRYRVLQRWSLAMQNGGD